MDACARLAVYVLSRDQAAADIPKALLARVTDSVKPEPEDFVSGYLFALSIMCGETHPDFVFDPLAYGRVRILLECERCLTLLIPLLRSQLHCEDILKVFSVYLQVSAFAAGVRL